LDEKERDAVEMADAALSAFQKEREACRAAAMD
jgi:hypothetical protein